MMELQNAKEARNVRELLLEVLGGSMAHMKFRYPLLCVKNPWINNVVKVFIVKGGSVELCKVLFRPIISIKHSMHIGI